MAATRGPAQAMSRRWWPDQAHEEQRQCWILRIGYCYRAKEKMEDEETRFFRQSVPYLYQAPAVLGH